MERTSWQNKSGPRNINTFVFILRNFNLYNGIKEKRFSSITIPSKKTACVATGSCVVHNWSSQVKQYIEENGDKYNMIS